MLLRTIAGSTLCSVLVSGCTTLDLRAGFSEVDSMVEGRARMKLFWNNGTELDREVGERLSKLVKGKLTAEQAAQVALLNNRELQAVYSELGVAQADLVQAGLLKNPLFDAIVTFPVTGGRPDLELTAVMSFLDIFYLPLRKRVAESRFEEAKTRVAAAVLDLAGQVRSAFYEHQANEQMLELRQSIVQSLDASKELAQRLHQAGNISDLDYTRERVLLEGAKLRLRAAETASRQSRERLNILMGLWGKETGWQAEERLPEIPQEAIPIEGIERAAIEKSIDLVRARQRIAVAGEQLGLNRASALAVDLDGGARGERNEGAWAVGPVLELPMPLFDQGQARVARAVADRLQGARDRALYYRDIVLPLQERVVNEAQLHYNAMQLGPIELLRAREQQIEAAGAYVEALRDHWTAYSEYQQLMTGRLPQSNGPGRCEISMKAARISSAGH